MYAREAITLPTGPHLIMKMVNSNMHPHRGIWEEEGQEDEAEPQSDWCTKQEQ